MRLPSMLLHDSRDWDTPASFLLVTLFVLVATTVIVYLYAAQMMH